MSEGFDNKVWRIENHMLAIACGGFSGHIDEDLLKKALEKTQDAQSKIILD